MIISASISTARLLMECKEQTSYDFQGMRLKNPEGADALYDDFVMNDNNAPDIIFPIEEFGADMAHALRTLLHSFSSGRDIIHIDIECANDIVGSEHVVESLMRQYFKYRLLSWWYTSRDVDLATLYTQKAAQALDNLFAHCIPHTSTIPQRYF